MEAAKIKKFINDPRNIDNCEECPYNEGGDAFQHRRPCGQWNCWVSLHCNEDMEDEDE